MMESATLKSSRRKPGPKQFFAAVTRPVRAVVKAAVFFMKVFPMLPSKAIDWVTKTPLVEKVEYPTVDGFAEGDLYRPSGEGPFPGIVVCLGVVPFGTDHPQVPVLGNALARSGFTALLYWSPAMRDFRLEPDDARNIALAYNWLVEQPCVDPARSGLLGTCVGGSFALMAAAQPLIQDRVGIVAAYAPFSSKTTFARDIASQSRVNAETREPWQVDQLTRRVFVHSITAWLPESDADSLRSGFEVAGRQYDGCALSADGQAVYDLLTAQDTNAADAALQRLALDLREKLAVMSPLNYVPDLHSPLIVVLHDIGDQVIPVGESRRLMEALAGRSNVHYTEMRFQHLDPVKGKLPVPLLVRELGKFFLAVYPIFWQAV